MSLKYISSRASFSESFASSATLVEVLLANLLALFAFSIVFALLRVVAAALEAWENWFGDDTKLASLPRAVKSAAIFSTLVDHLKLFMNCYNTKVS